MEVPEAIPFTTPSEEPTVAMLLSLLLQVPPLVASVSEEVAPRHTLVVPLIEDGAGLTTIDDVTKQPEPTE